MVAEVLEIETEAMAGRHNVAGKVFKDAGGFSPTIGIIGTVMGLIHVLENLDNPETLGPAISGAFIATLYGVALANVIFLPDGEPPAGLSEAEVELGTLTLEGILAIQAGDNPRILAEKLLVLHPARAARRGREAGAAAGAAGGRRRPGRGRGR